MGRIVVNAPAKINLFLHIIGKRSDGYHLLDSLVAFASYGDVIEVENSEGITLEIGGKYAGSLVSGKMEENLVWKAASALREYSPVGSGAKIKLIKNLPVGSGIGGGSADAAAAIRALAALWKPYIQEGELFSLALKMGSDVPVCLYGKPAWMRGAGEALTPVNLPEDVYIVLVNPNVSISTLEIFKEFKLKDLPLRKKNLAIVPSFEEMANNAWYGNDLEPAAINKLPVIAGIISLLESQNGCCFARMSGSGATCFGIFKNESDASKAATEMEKKYPGFWCISTHINHAQEDMKRI